MTGLTERFQPPAVGPAAVGVEAGPGEIGAPDQFEEQNQDQPPDRLKRLAERIDEERQQGVDIGP